MTGHPELYYSAKIHLRNWFCLTEFNWFVHYGIHGNEEADALARAGSSPAFVRPEPCLSLAPSIVQRRQREWLLKSHCAAWSFETACRQCIKIGVQVNSV
jgi:hypothetical protein